MTKPRETQNAHAMHQIAAISPSTFYVREGLHKSPQAVLGTDVRA